MRKTNVFVLLACLLGVPCSALAEDSSNLDGAHAGIFRLPESTIRVEAPRREMTILVVDKKSLKAELKTWPANPNLAQTLASFQVAVGKALGDKQRQGDEKTPEGIYFPKSTVSSKVLPPRYGDYAITLDFPNPHDRALGKTGGGIWLHGVEDETRIKNERITRGCVAFYNDDISKLSQWIEPEQSVVVIAEDAEVVNQPEDLKSLSRATRNWLQAWRALDVNEYGKFYHDEFRRKGYNRDRYLKYKNRIFKRYTSPAIEVSTVRTFTHEDYGITVMNEVFDGEGRYYSSGRKVLYWRRTDSGQWQIFREYFKRQPIEFRAFDASDVRALGQQAQLRGLPPTLARTEPLRAVKDAPYRIY